MTIALRIRVWPLVSGLAALLAGLSLVSVAQASPGPAQRLVDAYSPIVMMRVQHGGDVCDSSEEQYSPPTSVNLVLGNPRVRLLEHAAHGTHVIKRAPTAADLAGRGKNYYLDLPGDPLSPGCTYAHALAALRRAGHAPPVTYAHIDRQPGHSGLAVQYWFYYYFNQFNDLHESDWEGMQITFDAGTPARALSAGPDGIVLFQHAGGEHGPWTDSKVQKQGTHPVVYSAAGSHATFYGSALWLGNGQNGSGVGCDNTTAPLVAIRPRPVLLPNVPSRKGEFAWLSFTGHWGQREAGFNDGPAGPNTKTVWRKPFTWMDQSRTASPKVPDGSLFGPSVANVFCGAVARVSTFLNLAAKTGPGAIAVALIIALVIILPLGLTKWRPTEPQPLGQRRRAGQLLLASGRLYWRHGAALVLIALISALIIAAFNELEALLRGAIHDNGTGASATDSGYGVAVSTSVSIARTIATPIGAAAVIAFVRELERGRDPGLGPICRVVLARLWRLVAVELLALILVALLALTIIGIPFAIRKYVDWQFAQQEILFEDRKIRESLRGSTRVVRGHWWQVTAVILVLWLMSQIPGPGLGFALLFTNVSPGTLNLVGSALFMLLLPYVNIGRTLLYLDLAGREVTEPKWAKAIAAPVRRLTRVPVRALRARS